MKSATDKIESIRKFLLDNHAAFYNNIIVSLPDDVQFKNSDEEIIDIDRVGQYDVCTMTVPDRMNSICVIDGQHRIFAHYEGDDTDDNEFKVETLRNQLHLLVVNMFSFKRSIKCVSKKRTWFSIVGFPFGLRGGGGSTIVL